MTDAAPFYNDLAEGPPDGAASWVQTSDGTRLRIGHWAKKAKNGTVLIFPGRTEYIEKYGAIAKLFESNGYATAAIDWRGQGLADRALKDPTVGHVGDFSEYQQDVAAYITYARAQGLPEPYHMIGHSMGGCIGLRAAMNGISVKSAGFSAPMWGIKMNPALRPFAWLSSGIGTKFGFGHLLAPAQRPVEAPGIIDFKDNLLTADRAEFDYFQRQIKARPELGLGNASLGWLNAALREMAALERLPAPDLPSVTLLGSAEAIVDPDAVRARANNWPRGTLVELQDGRHEVMLEIKPIRDRVFSELLKLFDQNR